MPRGSSRSVSKTPPTAEKRVTRGSVRSPAAKKTSPAVKSPVKSSAAVSSPKKSAVPAARSRSRAATSKSPQPQPQQQRGRSISTKRKSSSPKTAKTEKKPTGKKTASRGRSRQRKTKKAKSETEEEDDDEDEMSDDEEVKIPVKRAAKGSRSKSKEKAVAAKSPARSRARPKSSLPKASHAPTRGRRSHKSAKDEEEEAEHEEKVENNKEEGAAVAAADEEDVSGGEEESMDESPPADDVKPVDVPDDDKADAAPAGDSQIEPAAVSDDSETQPAAVAGDSQPQSAAVSGDSEIQPAVVSDDDDSVCLVEDLPHVDRKRKFDEVEDESDDVEEVGVVSPAKVLKVCEDSDVKTSSAEAPVDGETICDVESNVAMVAESKLSLPLSSETNIEDDYVVITPDDVPPVDSDEVMDTAAKMVPSLSSTVTGSCSNDTSDTVAIPQPHPHRDAVPDPRLHREYVANPAVFAASANSSRCFTLGSYNILADYHAQNDYGHGKASWLTAEQLSLSSRHERLMEELVYLDEDVICLQEVGEDYMHDTLQPALESLGYSGVFIARNTEDYCEGEATFYRTSYFRLEASESLLLSDVIDQALDASAELDDMTRELLKKSLSTHAVAMLTRLRSVATGDVLTVANIHVAYDKFERPDRQCLQLAVTMQRLIELAGGMDKPHIICGDFNAWPGVAPYQLMADGHLSDASFTDLQAILTVDSGDSQLLPVVNFWSDGFQYPLGSAMKSAYSTVQGSEPATGRFGGVVQGVDYIWFSSVSLDVLGVLKVVAPQLIEDGLPTAVFPSDHVSVKASFAFK